MKKQRHLYVIVLICKFCLPSLSIKLQHLIHNIFFFFNDTATTEIYTLYLHDALPISSSVACTSRVSVLVIDCTVMGAPPPTLTLPIWICRVLRRLIMSPRPYLKNLNASIRTRSL